MIDPLENLPFAVDPVYATASLNEEIDLFSGPAKITSSSGKEISGNCALKYSWLPAPKVRFDFEPSSNTLAAFEIFQEQMNTSLQLEFEAFKTPGRCLLTHLGGDKLQGLISGAWSIAKSKEVNVVRFHLLNCPQFLGGFVRYGIPSAQSFALAGRIELRTDDWEVIVDPVHNLGELSKTAEITGGFAITHVGLLERVSKKEITVDEAKVY
jgi:hypothetical protein